MNSEVINLMDKIPDDAKELIESSKRIVKNTDDLNFVLYHVILGALAEKIYDDELNIIFDKSSSSKEEQAKIASRIGINLDQLQLVADYKKRENVKCTLTNEDLFKKLDRIIPESHKRVLATDTDVNKLPEQYLSHLVNEYKDKENIFDENDLKRYASYLKKKQNYIENKGNINKSQMEAYLSYIRHVHKNLGIPDSLLYDKIREGKYNYILKEDNIDPKAFVEYLDSKNKSNNIEEYIEQLKKEYQLSDEELYDRLKKGMFSKVVKEEETQKLLDHLETKPSNIDKYIERLKKDYQLSDEELYDRLKKGMFSQIIDAEKAQKLIDHLETKPSNIDKYIEQLKKDYQLSDEELYDRLKKGMFSKVMRAEKVQKLLDHLENKKKLKENENEDKDNDKEKSETAPSSDSSSSDADVTGAEAIEPEERKKPTALKTAGEKLKSVITKHKGKALAALLGIAGIAALVLINPTMLLYALGAAGLGKIYKDFQAGAKGK